MRHADERYMHAHMACQGLRRSTCLVGSFTRSISGHAACSQEIHACTYKQPPPMPELHKSLFWKQHWSLPCSRAPALARRAVACLHPGWRQRLQQQRGLPSRQQRHVASTHACKAEDSQRPTVQAKNNRLDNNREEIGQVPHRSRSHPRPPRAGR
jgi:hypothetical protein